MKLVLQFIIFGLLLGFFVYFFAVVLDSGDIIKDVVILVSNKFSHSNKINKEQKSSLQHEYVANLITDLNIKYSSITNVVLIRMYALDKSNVWNEIKIDKNKITNYFKTDKETSDFLFLAFKKDFTKSPGKENTVLFFNGYIRLDEDISPETVNMLYLRIDKTIFFEKIKSDRELLTGYAVLVIIFSIILGNIFAHKITRPINELIKSAQNISKGDYTCCSKITCNDEIGYLGYTLNMMSQQVDRHIKEIEYRSKAMVAMNDIDKTVLKKLFDPNVIDMVAETVAAFLGRGIVLLAVPDETGKIIKISTYDKFESDGISIRADNIIIDKLPPENDFRKQGFLEITMEAGTNTLPPWISDVLTLDHGTIIHAPLYSAEVYQGSCFIIDDTKTGFSQNEKEAIRMLADQVGVALQNSRIYIEKENLFLELLYALTRAIDAKSKWTSGHSERVADFSVMLSIALNLPEKDIETLKISAMLHDIGKIGTPETILDKPGILTTEEYDEIKKHPVEGSKIIGGIRSYKKIVPGILYHHEHWDGSGYPEGLKENNIPLLSRIITIADVYDAIIADRPYRKGMEKDQVKNFMFDNAGKLFDPKLLNIFMGLVEKK